MILGFWARYELKYRAPDGAEWDLLTAFAHPLSLPGGPLQADRHRLRLFFHYKGPLESKLSRPFITKKPDDLHHPAYPLAVRGGF